MVETASAQTIGQAIIDNVIAIATTTEFSTTQLYVTVIVVSISFSFYLLNSGGSSALTMINNHDESAASCSLNKPKTVKKEQFSSSSTSNSPEPKWHILKITNYVAATGFLLSVLQFASDASTYLNDSTSLLQFLGVWSVFLCYFFGFFGISFIELDDFVVDDQQQQHIPLQQQVTPVRKNKIEERYVKYYIAFILWERRCTYYICLLLICNVPPTIFHIILPLLS